MRRTIVLSLMLMSLGGATATLTPSAAEAQEP